MASNLILKLIDCISILQIRSCLKKYDVVCFDVFDTLIKRDVAKPENVFSLIEKQNHVPGFAMARIRAEKMCRSQKSEITLNDIYCEPPLQKYADFQQVEIETEYLLSCPNKPIQRIYEDCVRQRKQIYIVTDMYLPDSAIESILKKNGYSKYLKIYVSGSVHASKITGEIYKRLLEENNLCAKKVLHIGDNVHKDGIGAFRAGVRPCLIRTEIDHLNYCTTTTDLTTFINNRILDCRSLGERLGFEVFGPLLVGFSQWVNNQLPEGKFPYFLSRDMDLVYQIFQLFYGKKIRARYLEISRASIARNILRFDENWAEYAIEVLPQQVLCEDTIRQELGLCETTLGNKQLKFDLRNGNNQKEISAYLKRIQLELKQNSDKRDTLGEYLWQNGVDENAVLIDIGYGGTTQKALIRKVNKSLSGMYLAASDKLSKNIPSGDYQVYAFGGSPAPFGFFAGQPLLEHIISEPIGKTLDYVWKGDTVKPVHSTSLLEEPIKKEIRLGIQKFALEYKNSALFAEQIQSDEAINIFISFIENPKLKDAKEMNSCVFEDGEQYGIINFNGWFCYLKKPEKLVRDFQQSHWKIAFLKLLFRFPLPYGYCYEKLKGK